MELEILLLTVVSLLSHANGAKYELSVADEDIFSSCNSPDPGTLDINGLMDLSELSTSMSAEGVTISGNATLIWDINLEDRVQMNTNLLYFDRGTWTPTAFSMVSKDFCKSMYDKNQYYYKYWTGYITNDIQDKCINVPGTKIIHKTFTLSLTANVMGPLREGTYKAQLMLRAYDATGIERPTRICLEIRGDLFKV
ncbi:uncharacterized protein LOC128252659 [Drosophila gunungcola]|nr:uncharacterized protein LOC128252659 [Drosophila gunungcola]